MTLSVLSTLSVRKRVGAEQYPSNPVGHGAAGCVWYSNPPLVWQAWRLLASEAADPYMPEGAGKPVRRERHAVALYIGRWRLGRMDSWAKNHVEMVLRPMRADAVVIGTATVFKSTELCDDKMAPSHDAVALREDARRASC